MPRQDEDELDDELEISARSFWSGTITFGLVSIPVDFYPATRPKRSMRMLAPDGSPVKRQYFCPEEETPLTSEDLVRGYETEKGSFVLVSDEELEALEPKKSRDIDLQQFVPRGQVPPLLYERGYYLAPGGNSKKAYRLLARTLEETDRAGIATFVMRGRSYLVAILGENGILRADTLRYADEVRNVEALELDLLPEPKPATVKKFVTKIKKLTADTLDLDELTDESAQKIRTLAEAKRKKKKDIVQLEEEQLERGRDVVDLAEVLKKRLGVDIEAA